MSPTTAGLLQLGVLLVALAVVYVPFGNYLARVYTDQRHWRLERAVYRVVRVDPDSEQRWTGYAAAMLVFSFASIVLLYLMHAAAGAAAAEPGPRAGGTGHRVQHRGVVRDEHQLAVLRARDGDGSSGADGRPDGAELRLGGGGHGGRGGAGARFRPRLAAIGSATSGSTWSAGPSGCCCRSRSSPPSCWSRWASR